MLQRKEHAISKLECDRDIWVATADGGGHAHLVPLSLHWDGSLVVVTAPRESISTRRVWKSRQARLAPGDTHDVVVLDVVVDVVAVGSGNDHVSDRFKDSNRWGSPRDTRRIRVFIDDASEDTGMAERG